MLKIVLLPLDERPCNYNFPNKLYNSDFVKVVMPDRAILGDKKQCANSVAIEQFLLKECQDAHYLIVSSEMLLYGGLVPSRLHHLDDKTVSHRQSILQTIKHINNNIKIYLFSLIMRCPSYSNADEEPDYYDICGKEIHQIGKITHQYQLGQITEQQYADNMSMLQAVASQQYIDDYVARRQFNLQYVIGNLHLLDSGVVDFMLIPQDDSAPYGYTALDQQKVRAVIEQHSLDTKCLIYPGADEIALTLLARAVNDSQGKQPTVSLRYACEGAKYVVPLYEDRSLNETLKYHIIASGCRLAYGEADITMMVTAPPTGMVEASCQGDNLAQYKVERNIIEQALCAQSLVADNKVVTYCDNAYGNGGDLSVISVLNQLDLLDKVCYAGWNTSSNTAGTALSQAVYQYHYGKTANWYNFLAQRYVEDVLYCGIVRKLVSNSQVLQLGYNYFDVGSRDGEIAQAVCEALKQQKQVVFGTFGQRIDITRVEMPWRRMFEVDVDAIMH